MKTRDIGEMADDGARHRIAAETGRGWWDWHPERPPELLANGKSRHFRPRFFRRFTILRRMSFPEELSELVDEGTFVDWACRSALKRLDLRHG